MVRFLILMSIPKPLDRFEVDSAADRSPRHAMALLRDRLDARVVLPSEAAPDVRNRIEARIPGVGTAEHWANAAELIGTLGPQDVVFAVGEDAGFPLAMRAIGRRARPRLAVVIHNPSRFRVRNMARLMRLSRQIDLVITNTPHKRDYIVKVLGFPAENVIIFREQTDTLFFRPGEGTPGKIRPLIGSGGLEQRDYITLAEATETLPVDVRISAASPNAVAHSDTFPDPLPPNMTVRHHDWPDLRQLYRDSDVFVISLKQNSYQAGLTTLMEAFACKTPVIMTKTAGSMEDFEKAGALVAVPPGDAPALRAAILRVLGDTEFRNGLVERAFALVQSHHRLEQFVAELSERLQKLQPSPRESYTDLADPSLQSSHLRSSG